MNPIAVSVTPAGKAFPGVAEASAAGAATPSSLADLFCQMLATAQAGIAVTAEGADAQGECADGECSLTDAAATESSDAASVLAAALMPAVPSGGSTTGAPVETPAVVPIAADAGAATAKAMLADAVVVPVMKDVDAAEAALTPMPTDAPDEAAPPTMTLAMQTALARVGLGTEGSISARRFGDVAVTFARPVQPVEADTGDAAAQVLRDAAQPSVKAGPASADASETGGESDGSSADAYKPAATLASPKSSEFAATKFDVNTGIFGGAEVQAASRARTEPVMQAAQANVPQSVSVREVGDTVIRSVHFLAGRTEDVVTVRLVPQSLGELRIAVHSGERGMEVVLTAANNAARDALEHNLVGLREALSREGMTIERVSVQVFAPFDAGHQPASGQQNTHGSAGQSARQPNTAYRESSDSPPQHQGNNEQQPRRQQHAGRLNMWV